MEDITRLGSLQSLILNNLSGYLLPGGTLVYSTCTVFHEENEDVVEEFLSHHTEFRSDPIDKVLPESCVPFITGVYFKTFPRGDGMDGFFAARLTKKA